MKVDYLNYEYAGNLYLNCLNIIMLCMYVVIYIYIFKLVTGACKKLEIDQIVSIILFPMLMTLFVFLLSTSKQRTILFNHFNHYCFIHTYRCLTLCLELVLLLPITYYFILFIFIFIIYYLSFH